MPPLRQACEANGFAALNFELCMRPAKLRRPCCLTARGRRRLSSSPDPRSRGDGAPHGATSWSPLSAFRPSAGTHPSSGCARPAALHRGSFPRQRQVPAPGRACVLAPTGAQAVTASSSRTARSGRRAEPRSSPSAGLRNPPAGAASSPALKTPHDNAPRWTGLEEYNPVPPDVSSEGCARLSSW